MIFKTGGLHTTFFSGNNSFLIAMFMSLFVIYGFDTASTLAEETKEPRRNAPKAVLFSVIGAFVIGGVFLLATLMAIPNMHKAIAGAFGPAKIIEANFSPALRHAVLVRGVGGDLRVLPVDHGGDDQARLQHGPRQPAAALQAAREGGA